jgi:hypothetical protein
MNRDVRPDRGVISSIYRWLGRHPKTCLLFVALLAMLHGAQLLVHFYDRIFIPAPFFTAIGLWLVLLALGSLVIAVGKTVGDRLVHRVDLVATNLSAQNAHTQGLVEARHPVWNAGTSSSAIYGHRPRAVETHDFDAVVSKLRCDDDPNEDTHGIGLVS